MKAKLLKSLLAVLCLLCSITLYAHDFKADYDYYNIYYNIVSEDNRTVEVTFKGNNYDSSEEYAGSVVIPESVTYKGVNYSVTSIGDEAFYDCSSLREITIPNSVTSIGEGAFKNCTILTSVNIPNRVISIGNEAFYGCTGLIEVYITDLSAWCRIEFWRNAANPLTYAQKLYLNNELVTSLVIPDDVTSIGNGAFIGYTGLTDVTIPNSVTSIGNEAFRDCTGLTEVTIPNSVTSIGGGAFWDCTGLTEITIPNSVTSIGYYAFRDCSGLTEITIPNSVTSIGNEAFRDCTGLTTVNFNAENCTTMGSYSYPAVFKGCGNLTTVNIGDAVKTIPDYAFYDCTRIREISIPNSVAEIGSSAFYLCKALRIVTIGIAVTEIGESAFDGCENINTVNSYAEVPPNIYSFTFNEYVNDNATLHIVKGCKEAYADAKYWKYFLNITEDLEGAAIKNITCDNNDVPAEYYDLSGCRVIEPTHGIYIMKQGSTVKKVVL